MYKVGDKVRIRARKYLVKVEEDDVCVTYDMRSYGGRVVTISEKRGCGEPYISRFKEVSFSWRDVWFEPLTSIRIGGE